jgi:hypothetical protein
LGRPIEIRPFLRSAAIIAASRWRGSPRPPPPGVWRRRCSPDSARADYGVEQESSDVGID